MAKKKIPALTPGMIEKSTWAWIEIPADEQYNFIFGEPVIWEDGVQKVKIRAYPELMRNAKELHPNWKVGEPFVELPDDADSVE